MLYHEIAVDRVKTLFRTTTIRNFLIILIAGGIFFAHSMMFADWIVDDAAISFVYARNLADGHGLVAQPGLPPVEGYSNFTWVLVFVPFFALHSFQPLIVPKLVSFILVMCTFILVFKACREASDGSIWVPALVLALLAINTPFVVWTSSGMENPLYVFLLSLYLLLMVRASDSVQHTLINSLTAGMVAGLIALTRPEGILYAIAYPVCLLLFVKGSVVTRFRACFKNIFLYGLLVSILIGGYVVFRLAYFHEILPMPYYSKSPDLLLRLSRILILHSLAYERVYDLATSFGGYAGMWIFIFLIGSTTYLLIKGEYNQRLVPYGILAVISVVAFVLLVPDWMGEYRFATFFFVVLYGYFALLIQTLIVNTQWDDRVRRRVIIGVSVMSVCLSAIIFIGRSIELARSPTLPMWQVARILGNKLNDYSRLLQLKNSSVMTTDVGGTLYSSKLRVYDLGGLVNPFIAKNKALPLVHNYIFRQVKPTFLFIHGFWSKVYKLELDPRFHKEYIPLVQMKYDTASSTKTSLAYSGMYMRKDAVGNDPKLLDFVRQDLLKAIKNTKWDF